MENDFNETIWKILDIYFRDNPQGLIRHHIDSYNDFVENGISQIFRETNPKKIDFNRLRNCFSAVMMVRAFFSENRLFTTKTKIFTTCFQTRPVSEI